MSAQDDTDQTKANTKEFTICFRLDKAQYDILNGKAKEAHSKKSDFLRDCISGQKMARNDDQKAVIKALLDDMSFIFDFFQRNATKLTLKETDKERFKVILQKVRELGKK